MRDNKSSSDDLLEEPQGNEGSASRQNNGADSREATDPHTAHQAEKNLQNTFKPRRIDLTPDAPVNIGYIGGVRMVELAWEKPDGAVGACKCCQVSRPSKRPILI
jgi:hypothetical protein